MKEGQFSCGEWEGVRKETFGHESTYRWQGHLLLIVVMVSYRYTCENIKGILYIRVLICKCYFKKKNMSQTEKLETEVEFKYEKPVFFEKLVLVFIFNQEQLFILSELFFRQCLYVEVIKIRLLLPLECWD